MSQIIADILSSRESRSATFGLENPLSTRSWAAVKTGTSKDMRDNWCIGFSDRYTVGVWVGNASGSPMWNVSGITGAAPAWAEIMNHLHRTRPSQKPTFSENLVRVEGQLHLPHTEHLAMRPQYIREASPRITYPLNGLIVAIDPDIPPANQRVFLEAENAREEDRLLLDGEEVAKAQNGGVKAGWSPLKAGHHRLELVRAGGEVVDRVEFEVRGGSPSAL